MLFRWPPNRCLFLGAPKMCYFWALKSLSIFRGPQILVYLQGPLKVCCFGGPQIFVYFQGPLKFVIFGSPKPLFILGAPKMCYFWGPQIFVSATNAVSERCFSAMKRVRSYLRATMTDNRLNHLMTIHIHKHLTDERTCSVLQVSLWKLVMCV